MIGCTVLTFFYYFSWFPGSHDSCSWIWGRLQSHHRLQRRVLCSGGTGPDRLCDIFDWFIRFCLVSQINCLSNVLLGDLVTDG